MGPCPKGVSEYCSEGCDWNEQFCQFPLARMEGCLWQQLLCVCREQPELLPLAWGSVKTNPTALHHPYVWYQ